MESDESGSTKAREPLAMREQILSAARALIAERGFAAVSLADIATVVGVSKTAVAYYYHPKDQLLVDLLEKPRLGLQLLLATPKGQESFLNEYVRFIIDNRDTFALIFLDPSILRHPVFGERIREARKTIAQALGGADSSTATVTGWAALGAINIAVLGATHLDSAQLQVEVIAIARRVLELVQPDPPEILVTPTACTM